MTALLRRASGLIPAIAAIFVCFAVEARPRVLVTVDVESLDNLPLAAQIDPVCSDGSHCGLMKIASLLEKHHLAGTFFLNVYEYKTWGEPMLQYVALQLQSRGHDVALHTHPQWAYDPKRNSMYDYSLEEQTQIIKDGVQLLERWTGRPVVAHRAGDYTADRNTLQALARNGIYLDSSLFLGHPHSRLNDLGLPNNLPSTIDRITEIPVTVYERAERPKLFGRLAPPLTSIRKIDPDWFLNDAEALAAIDASIEADFPFLVVFLHSFSFIAGPGTQGTPAVDSRSEQIFEAMLQHIASKGLEAVTLRDLAGSGAATAGAHQDSVPSVTVPVPTLNYIAHALHLRPTPRALAAAAGAAAIAGLGVFVLIMRRRARRRSPPADH